MGKQVIVPALASACLLAGCGSGQAEPSVTARCVLPLRFEGKIYNGIDHASEPPQESWASPRRRPVTTWDERSACPSPKSPTM